MDDKETTTQAGSENRKWFETFISNFNFMGGPIRLIRGYIQSNNFISGISGWYLGSDGTMDGFRGSSNNTVTTKSFSDATGVGNTVWAHGLGVAPDLVRVNCAAGAANYMSFSSGTYNGTNQSMTVSTYFSTGPGAFSSSPVDIAAAYEGGTTSGQVGTISTDATNVTITWTRIGTPTGTFSVLIEATVL